MRYRLKYNKYSCRIKEFDMQNTLNIKLVGALKEVNKLSGFLIKCMKRYGDFK